MLCCVVLKAYSRHVTTGHFSLFLLTYQFEIKINCFDTCFLCECKFLLSILRHRAASSHEKSLYVVMTAAFQSNEQNCMKINFKKLENLHKRCDWLKPTRTKSKKVSRRHVTMCIYAEHENERHLSHRICCTQQSACKREWKNVVIAVMMICHDNVAPLFLRDMKNDIFYEHNSLTVLCIWNFSFLFFSVLYFMTGEREWERGKKL